MKDIDCARCHKKMTFVGSKNIQLGKTGWILGDLPNLIAGALLVDIYTCPECGSIEFFKPDHDEDDVSKVACPNCGNIHDFDYPKCPFCKFDYYKK